MLSTLISSKTRVKILTLFLARPDERFYYTDLIKRLKVTSSAVQNELARLRKIGLLETKKEANVRYFWVNKNFPLYPELKSIILKTIGLADQLKGALGNLGEIKVAFIYGSVAKNSEDVKSDIDLMIIGHPDLDVVTETVGRVEDQLSREINYSVFEPKEWQDRVKKRDAFVSNVLKEPKIFLIGNGDGLRKVT